MKHRLCSAYLSMLPSSLPQTKGPVRIPNNTVLSSNQPPKTHGAHFLRWLLDLQEPQNVFLSLWSTTVIFSSNSMRSFTPLRQRSCTNCCTVELQLRYIAYSQGNKLTVLNFELSSAFAPTHKPLVQLLLEKGSASASYDL